MRHNSFAELLRFPSPPTERKNKPNVLGWHIAGVPHSARRAEMTELRSAYAPAQRQGEKPGQLPGPSWSKAGEASSPSWAAQLTSKEIQQSHHPASVLSEVAVQNKPLRYIFRVFHLRKALISAATPSFLKTSKDNTRQL